jgi:hypothetical protein
MDDVVKPIVRLIGEDSNAGSIMGRTTRALKKAGNSEEIINRYRMECISGDYANLLRVTMAYTEQPDEPEDDYGEEE